VSNESTIPTPASPDVCTSAVLIDGQAIGGEFHILSITVNRELNRIPSASIILMDGEAAKATFAASNTALFIPGKQIEIQLGYRAHNDTVFKGIIIKHSIRLRKNGSQLIIDCRDSAAKMCSGRHNRYFVDQKDSEIMESLIDNHGLDKSVDATQIDLKQVVQYEASDWDFLLCRAEANGYVIKVEDGKITAAAPATQGSANLTVQYGTTLLELDAEIDARWQSPAIKASSWDAGEQSLLDSDAAEPGISGSGNLNNVDLAAILGNDPLTLRHGGKLSEPELQAWADARLLKERLSKIRGRAKFMGIASLMPDQLLEVQGIGERFQGTLYVSGIRHSFAQGSWHTDAQLGLSAEPFAQTYDLRPLPAAGLLPAISGLHSGVVTALQDDPDGEERIKVRLPIISSDEDGIWARLMTLDAGKDRGTYYRPEIDDEVIVGFLHDDPRHPVVLGMCHSSAKPSPEPASDDNHKKGYVSREKLKLSFDDDKKVITLETPGGNKLVLSDEDKGITLEDQNGNKIVLNDSGIQFESSKEMQLKASQDFKLEAMNIEMKAQSNFKAEGASSAEVSGASTSIKGNASTVIQGGMVQIN
jgi:Rhs element Vgr protein